MEELKDEEMYVLVAPDGSAQVTTLAPDFAMCMAMINMMADIGYSKKPDKLFSAGYKIIPVKVSISQHGDENKAFNKSGKP